MAQISGAASGAGGGLGPRNLSYSTLEEGWGLLPAPHHPRPLRVIAVQSFSCVRLVATP